MPTNEASIAGPLLQCVLEWRVNGALDGTTVAPGLTIDSNILTQRPDSFGAPFVILVPGAAGLFNPDGFGDSSTRADRYLQWIRIVPATGFPIPAGFRLQIVDASGLVPSVGSFLILEQIQAGAFVTPAFYVEEMNFVPQGSVVRVDGLGAAPPGTFHRITMGVRSATEVQDDPALDNASCCTFEPVVQAQIDTA